MLPLFAYASHGPLADLLYFPFLASKACFSTVQPTFVPEPDHVHNVIFIFIEFAYCEDVCHYEILEGKDHELMSATIKWLAKQVNKDNDSYSLTLLSWLSD